MPDSQPITEEHLDGELEKVRHDIRAAVLILKGLHSRVQKLEGAVCRLEVKLGTVEPGGGAT